MPRASALSALGCTLFSALLSALHPAPCSAESLAAPRPITPMSLGDVTQRRPTLRWNLPAGSDGAVVELCRDRACQFVIETLRASGTFVRPTRDLPARSVVFWRLRAMVGAVVHSAVSATWLFHVPARDAAGGIDSSSHAHLDVNSDGYDDVAVGSALANPSGREHAGTVVVHLGSEIGISQRSSSVLHGPFAGDYFGYSVASAGDVNGDGFGDLVVGAHNSDPQGRDAAGTASIFLGSLQGISSTPTRVLLGAEPQDLFGCSVASAGDVNLDGYGDLVIGAFDSGRTTSSRTGSLSVFHGSNAGMGVSPAVVLFGTTSRARFGWSVASAGDVNGDGFSDVVVGAYLARSRASANTGTATIYRGSPDGILVDRSQVLSGLAPGDRFGLSVASAGDLNGDGLSDVVVGAYEADPGGRVDAGTASVFYGRTGDLLTQPAVVLEGLAAQDRFGYSVSSAADVNGDGFDDLLVGAVLEDSAGRFNAGAARVFLGGFLGVSTTVSRVMIGASANDQFGGSVAGAGDVNRDGFTDIIVGAVFGDPIERIDTGTASIFHGSPTGTSALAATVLGGSTDHALYGISVATYGADSASSRTARLALVHSAGALSDRANRTVGLTSVVASKYF